MNASYLCIALSRRNVTDESLPTLFDNVENFVKIAASKYGYVARRLALGVHINKQIYVDFQIFVKAAPQKRRVYRKSKGRRNGYNDEYKYDDEYEDDEDDDDDDLSELSNEEDDSDLNRTTEDYSYESEEEEEETEEEEDDDDDPSFYAGTQRRYRTRKK